MRQVAKKVVGVVDPSAVAKYSPTECEVSPEVRWWVRGWLQSDGDHAGVTAVLCAAGGVQGAQVRLLWMSFPFVLTARRAHSTSLCQVVVFLGRYSTQRPLLSKYDFGRLALTCRGEAHFGQFSKELTVLQSCTRR
jgi:hypothetical protein